MASAVPRAYLFPGLIVLAGLLAYANSFQGCLFLDDVHAIVENPRIRTFPPSGLRPWQPRSLALLSLSLNYALDQLHVRGYHAFNLAIHLLAGLTLYGLVRRSLLHLADDSLYRRHAAGLALTVALLWTAHPLQTQSVTYIVQRMESLMGLFFLLTLYCLLRAADAQVSGARRGWYSLAVFCCGLGMASKEVMVVAPLVALFYDRIFLASSWREVLRRRGAVHFALACTALLLAASVRLAVADGIRNPSAGFHLPMLTPWMYVRSQPGVVLHYLRLCFWPYPLCIDYAWPVAEQPHEIVLPGLVLLGLLALTGWALWRRPRLGFLGACFFLILAPTSSILPIFDLAAEQRMYLPLAAVQTLAVLGAATLLDRLAQRANWTEGEQRLRSAAIVGSVACLLATMTFLRNEEYQSPLSIWGAVVELRPDNARARFNLAAEFQKVGRLADAEREYRAAVRLRPAEADWRVDLVKLLLTQGRADDAEEQIRDLLRHGAPDARAYEQFGLFLAARGKRQEAIAYFEQALHLDPGLEHATAHLRRLKQDVNR